MRLSASLLMMILSTLLSGCVTIGPKIERKTITVHKYDGKGRPVIVGSVDENVKVKMRYITKSGDEFTDVLDIGGWNVSPPALPETKEDATK